MASVTHGASNWPEYRVWQAMIARCHNPSGGHKDYAGRGIAVCARWRKAFENFIADMGRRPKGMTLERLNNSKGYGPENCVWASRVAQANNRRSNRRLTVGGITRTVAEWARHLDMKPCVIYQRLRRGVVGARALTPVPKGKWVRTAGESA